MTRDPTPPPASAAASADPYAFLPPGGACADEVRARDWAATPLGPPAGWPDPLKATLATILSSPDPMSVAWGDGLTAFFNDPCRPILGARAPGAVGRPFAEVWSDAWDDLEPVVGRALAGEGTRIEDVPLTVTRDGAPEETWWTFSCMALRDGAGGVRGVWCVAAEVTARVRSERHALAERERLAAMFEGAPGFFALLDGPEHRFVLANPAARRVTGNRDLLGRPVAEAVPEAARQGFVALLDEVRATGRAHAARGAPLALPAWPGGPVETRYLDFVYHPLRDAAGAVTGVVVSGHDVTESHAAAAELRELNRTLEARVALRTAERELLASIVDTTGVFILAIGPDHRWTAVNKAGADEAERNWGRRPAVGLGLRDLLGHLPADMRIAKELWDRALAGESFSVTQVVGEPGPARRHYDLRFEALRGEGDRPVGAFMTGLDVTERARATERLAVAEAQLRQSQKMEALGSLTGGVAHDFNNLLTPIIGGLDILRDRVEGARERRLVDGALQGAERAKGLVDRLLAFARRQPLRPGPVDLGELVDGLRDLVAGTAGPLVRLEVAVEPGLPPATADRNQLEMALLNLAANARDAMPDGGTLRLAAGRAEAGPGDGHGLAPGAYLRLAVADTGAGMDRATLARAVEPFFSTKGPGRGTGLGLSMVHGLAGQLGGALGIDSAPGRGTEVALWLPAAPPAPPAPAATPPPASEGARGRAALVVDDEALVRAATADMLRDLGWEVVEAPSAEAALGLAEAGAFAGGAPDLLVTDQLMPGLTGSELAARLRARWPGLPVLVVSGYDGAPRQGPAFPLLPKPFRRADLARRIDEVLAAPAPAPIAAP